MAGIINATMGEQQEEPQEAPAPGQMEGEEAGDPQIQEAYDRTMAAFMTVIYDEAIQKDIIAAIQANKQNPAQAIAETAINILVELDSKSGGKIPSEVLIDAAMEGMELIAELGEAAGFYQFDEAMQAKTLQAMVAIAIERGIIEQSEIEALMAEMDPAEMQTMVQQQQQLAGGV